MKAIVLIFVRTRDVKLPAGQSLANRADNSTIHNESAPPFWTWFIENPRPHLEIFP
jgi:hypothetical protein